MTKRKDGAKPQLNTTLGWLYRKKLISDDLATAGRALRLLLIWHSSSARFHTGRELDGVEDCLGQSTAIMLARAVTDLQPVRDLPYRDVPAIVEALGRLNELWVARTGVPSPDRPVLACKPVPYENTGPSLQPAFIAAPEICYLDTRHGNYSSRWNGGRPPRPKESVRRLIEAIRDWRDVPDRRKLDPYADYDKHGIKDRKAADYIPPRPSRVKWLSEKHRRPMGWNTARHFHNSYPIAVAWLRRFDRRPAWTKPHITEVEWYRMAA